MPSRKAIKRRVASVTTTKQIVSAMDMVAATKLQKVRAWLYDARPLAEASKGMLDRLKGCEAAADHVFFRERPGKRAAYAVITSDRGLCGSYNTNIAAEALCHMEEAGHEEQIIAIGLRGRAYFVRRGKQILRSHKEIAETAFYEDANKIGKNLISLFLKGQVDEVYVAYTHFESVLDHKPRIVRVLPIGDQDALPDAGVFGMKYEPDLQSVLDYAIPSYLFAFLYSAMLESAACEQASRMVSMDAANKNATDIIDELTRTYNRKRQAQITQEITEIIGGAEVSKS